MKEERHPDRPSAEFVRRLVTFGAYAAVMLALDWRLGSHYSQRCAAALTLTRYFGAGMQSALKKKECRKVQSPQSLLKT